MRNPQGSDDDGGPWVRPYPERPLATEARSRLEAVQRGTKHSGKVPVLDREEREEAQEEPVPLVLGGQGAIVDGVLPLGQGKGVFSPSNGVAQVYDSCF